jgi:glycosyltransferase involved in cell wall biosynthesis
VSEQVQHASAFFAAGQLGTDDRRDESQGSADSAHLMHPLVSPATRPARSIVLIPGADRFEDFFDKIGVSLDTFRDEFTGGWLFNYVRALRLANVRTVLLFASTRVASPVRFTHADTGAPVWILPTPRSHRKIRNGQRRFFPESGALIGVTSYFATPLRALARILREEQIQAILCQEYEHPRFDVCVTLGRALGVPVFATFQGGSETRTSIERPIRGITMHYCAGLIIPSHAEIARVRTRYGVPPHKIGHIPNPVEAGAAPMSERDAVRGRLGIGRDTRVVAWHGRVQVPTKGLDILFDAWNRICSQRPDADIRLLLVGTGRDGDIVRRRIDASDKVVWIDRYVFGRRELWSYLSAADVYTIPSRREGFAVSLLEAMACGLPAVASDVPGVSDVLSRGEEDGGIIVPRENSEALAAALRRLLEDPQLGQRLGAAARRRMERDFSLEVVGEQLRLFLFPEAGSERPMRNGRDVTAGQAPQHLVR